MPARIEGPPLAAVTRDAFVTWEMKALHRAARTRGAPFRAVDPRRASFDVTHRTLAARSMKGRAPLAVLGRIDLDSLPEGVRLLELLKHAGIPVLNDAAAFLRGRDKAVTAATLVAADLPHPPTWLLGRPPARGDVRPQTYPLVVKPVTGSGGRGVRRITAPEQLASIPPGEFPLLAQAYCGPVRRDLRVLVLQGVALGTVVRTPRKGDWRGNAAQGATFAPAGPSPHAESLAVAAGKAVGADFAAVDLIETAAGDLWIIEVNLCPGFEHFTRATGIDVAGRVVDAMLRLAAGGAGEGAEP